MVESKYLVFEKYITSKRKTPIYEVKNKETLDSLGCIYFYPAWRKYVFESNPEVIYDVNCLYDIIDFMKVIQADWRASLNGKKD